MGVLCCCKCKCKCKSKSNTKRNSKSRLKRLLFSNRFAKFIRNNTKQAFAEVIYSQIFKGYLSSILTEIIYSQTFKNYLLGIIEESRVSPFKEIASQYINQEVAIETTAGPLVGIVTVVGDDYLEIVESPTSTVLLPFTSINTIKSA
ncbi:DUF2642 domain-containing protein [Priestia megaterium]